jgi:acetyl-CoA carboxylase carboxyl transferase subunit alpha
MKLSAKDLLELNVIDEIILEPIGGAHRDTNLMLKNVRDSLKKNIDIFKTISSEEIFNQRKNKFLKIGRNKGFMNNLDELSSLKTPNSNFLQILNFKKVLIPIIGIILFSLFLFFI